MRIYKVRIGSTAEEICANDEEPILQQKYDVDEVRTKLLPEPDLIRALKAGRVRRCILVGNLEQFEGRK